MKLDPNLVRGYVLLAIDLCRLVIWIHMVVALITNYANITWGRFAELQKSISITKWKMGLHSI